MNSAAKLGLGVVFLGIWGSALLYVFAYPGSVPVELVRYGGRKLLFLSRHGEPTVFTLGMGLLFITLAAIGWLRLATGNVSEDA